MAAAMAREVRALEGDTATITLDGLAVRLTHLAKELWPGISKRDVIAYHVQMAPVLLPYLRDRPISAQVFPDGISGKHFWRKRIPAHAPQWLKRWTFHADHTTVTYLICDSVASLAWLANSGTIDIHPWHSRIDLPHQPDWAVFDLDPAEGASFATVVVLARLVHAALDHYGLRGYPKTTGQTGLQIYVPLRRGPDYHTVRAFVEGVSRAIGRIVPEAVSWEWTVSRRDGRVRMDYTQNVINKTLVAPYSVRPGPGAPVSAPIEWHELEDPSLRPDGWTMESIVERVQQKGDLFAPVVQGGQDLPHGDVAAHPA